MILILIEMIIKMYLIDIMVKRHKTNKKIEILRDGIENMEQILRDRIKQFIEKCIAFEKVEIL